MVMMPVPDDRGTAADADLGDLAVLLAGSGVEQARAVHGDALIDPQMKAAVSLCERSARLATRVTHAEPVAGSSATPMGLHD
jgi:hypothetical protein